MFLDSLYLNFWEFRVVLCLTFKLCWWLSWCLCLSQFYIYSISYYSVRCTTGEAFSHSLCSLLCGKLFFTIQKYFSFMKPHILCVVLNDCSIRIMFKMSFSMTGISRAFPLFCSIRFRMSGRVSMSLILLSRFLFSVPDNDRVPFSYVQLSGFPVPVTEDAVFSLMSVADHSVNYQVVTGGWSHIWVLNSRSFQKDDLLRSSWFYLRDTEVFQYM